MKSCALCAADGLEPMFTLPSIPLSHHLRKSAADPDPRFDLVFAHCQICGLLQIANPVDASTIYSDADTYTTGFQKPRHLDDLITTAIARQDPGSVLDVGCNDGALMLKLKEHAYGKIAGVELNAAAALQAYQKGFPTHVGAFDAECAAMHVAMDGPVDTVYCRHVIEHVPDIGAFMMAIRMVLRDGAQLVIELPEVEEALRAGSPAILWEEHVSYLSAPLARYMLERFGFEITDERRYAFGGGSIAFVARKVQVPALALPPASGRYPLIFKKRMDAQCGALRELVTTARARGYQIAMYGAAPRSVMVAAVAGIGDMLDVVLDDRADLWGRLFPGTNCTITHLGAASLSVGARTLCLLGVGAENEHRVIPRVGGGAVDPVFVSCFPPRDTLASIEAARREIVGSPAKAAA